MDDDDRPDRICGCWEHPTPQFTPAELELIAELVKRVEREYLYGLMTPDTHDALKALRTKALSLLFLEAAKDG